MIVWRWLVIGLLVVLFLVACTAVPDPTPTPVQNVAEVATLVMERPSATPRPTLTPTPQSTATLEPTATSTATSTQEIIASPTNTPYLAGHHLQMKTHFGKKTSKPPM